MGINYTPKTWADGAVVHDVDLDAEIRDPFTNLQAAWTSYTPTLTNITLGNGSLSCAYLQIGKTIIGRVGLTAGSTTTYGAGTLAFSLPVSPNAVYTGTLAGNIGVGSGFVNPAGTRTGVTVLISATPTFQLFGSGLVTNTSPATFGTSALIGFTFEYQAA